MMADVVVIKDTTFRGVYNKSIILKENAEPFICDR